MFSHPSARIDGPPDAPDGEAGAGQARESLAFPASYAQERIWFFYRLDPQDVSYNVPLLLRLTGDLDTDALQAALNDLIARHETLRTTFAESDGGLRQIVDEQLVLPMPTADLSALLPGRPEGPVTGHEPVRARLLEEIRRPFNLEDGPLLRARLLRLGIAEHCLLVCVHHIVIDGWSTGVFMRELAQAYRARIGGAAPVWTPLEIQYGDYAEWQRGALDGQPLAEGLAYWRQRLAGDLPALRLPTDRPQPQTRTFAGDQLDFILSPELTAGIKGLCRDQGATLYMVLLTGFAALLRRYTGQDDILVGSPSANRDNTQIEPLIGMFVNTLPLRVDTSGNPTFVDLLHRVRDVSLGAFAHQHIPLEKIVKEVAPQRDPGGNPLFRVVFALQNFERPDIELPGLTVSPVSVPDWTCRFDLELHLWEQRDRLRGGLVFSTDLFDRRTAERMTDQLRRLFEAVTADLACRLADLPLLTEQEQAHLAGGIAEGVTYDRDSTVTARFAGQVAARPEAVATCGAGNTAGAGSTASYREIDAWSTQLAGDLIGLGVSPGSRVALCCGRGLDAVIGLLGVLKAGAVCLPCDPADPPARLLGLVRDAEVEFVVTAGPSTGCAWTGGEDGDRPTVIDLGNSRYRGRPADGAPPAPEIRTGGGDPALVLCAEPRPVTVEHAELVRQLDLLAEAVGGLTNADTTRWWAPVGTQRSVWEMLLPLCHGARMTIAPDVAGDVRQDDAGALPEDGATVLLAVDRDLAWLADGNGLAAARAVVCTDRGLDPERAARLSQALDGRLRLAYCTAAAGPVALAPPVLAPAGGPAPALRPLRPVHVLDEYGSAALIGVYGAVHVGLPEAVTAAHDGGTLLRTGDLGRITVDGTDGTLELSGPEPGRAHVADHTIDLSAVADQVMDHESIRDCVVAVRHTTAGVAELVAYAVPTRDVTEEQIVRAARPALPAAVALAAVVLVSDLPRTAGGHLDEAALTRFPVLDEDLAARWERRWNASAERGRAAVVVTAGRAPEGPAEPVWLSGPVGGAGSPATVDDPGGAAGGAGQEALPSVSVGPPLRRLDVSTLDGALRRAVSMGGSGESLYIGPDGALDRQSYAELLDEASRLLGGLRGLGLLAGDKVLFQLAGNRDFVVGFWACVLGGYVAVPLAVPPVDSPGAPAAAKVEHAWESLGRPLVLTDRDRGRHLSAKRVAVIEELGAGPADRDWHLTRAEDLVLLMLTSGSTGTPKAVRLSHDNLLTHAAAARQHHELTPADVVFNWMPLDHVGGLIMSHVGSVVVGCRQIHAPTRWVLEEPLRWLSAMHAHRVTVTWAPNFAFALVNAHAARIAAQRWDLSALRLVLNGGEAVVDRVARRFVRLLEPHGLPAGAMHPIWGMSETSSGQVATVLPKEGGGQGEAAVEVGRPYPGLTIRITDDDGTVVPEGAVGHLQVSGPAVTSGYHDDPGRNRAAFTDDGWFRTGDLGLLRGGALTITGRAKDVIIIDGVNHPSHELEAVVEELDDVARSFTAACAVRTGGRATDELALFFVLAPGADPAATAARIRAKVLREAGVNPSYLIPVDRDRIPKTEIGKIQRSRLVQEFQDGAFDTEIARMDILLGSENTLPNWFFRPVWQPAELLHRPMPSAHGHTLLLADRHGLAERLAEALRAQGLTCTLASYGSTFVRHAADRFALPWDDPAPYDRFLDAIPTVDRVVHLASWAPDAGEPGPEEMVLAQRDGVECLAHLTAALAARAAHRSADRGDRSVRLYVVSSGSQQVRPDEPLAVARTPVIGLVKSLDQELPWLRGRHIDVLPGAGAQVPEQLLAEIDAPSGEVEVALRDGRRWARRLVRLPGGVLPETTPVFQEDGLYVVSGGLGGVAVEVARHLLAAHRVRLLLLGRTELPDPSAWDRLIAGGDELGRRLSAYRELSVVGDIAYAAVDITDAEALHQAVRTAEQKWSAELSGVLHLAGHFDERPVAEQTARQRAAVLAPKVAGGWALHQLVKDRPGTLFVSFSSVNGFLGGSGVGAYSAANAFLDALAAHQRRDCAVDGRSLAWSMWDERGMSRGYRMRELTAARGYRILGAREALRSLDAALRHDASHVLIGLDTDAAWVRAHVHAPARPLRALVSYVETTGCETVSARPEGSLPDRYGTPTWCELVGVDELPRTADGKVDRGRLTRTGPADGSGPAGGPVGGPAEGSVGGLAGGPEPATDLERAIAGIWRETLERDRIGVRENFFELGGHSILATQLLGRLRAALGVELTVAALLEDPTIAGLAARIEQAGDGPAGGMLDVLLPLRPHGSRAPLFCVHPGAGVSWPYAALLGGLNVDRPVHGIQARGLQDGEDVATSVQEMAADYLRQIRTVQPHGPYHLLGWSFGGLVTHAMAAQLRAEGERVGLLALLDTWPVGAATGSARSKHRPLPPAEELERALMEILVKSSGIERIPDAQVPLTAGALGLLRREGSPLQGLDDRAISALLKVMANDTELGYTYIPGRFDGDLVFFTAGKGEFAEESAAQESWRPFVGGRIENHVIACTHDDMLRPEAAADIARIIETELS
jgi:acyl-CoA synthetase (AMP-forming)/AMP-acid ligase II/thioesterase domain-containing protein/NADP-dependent 3-hydroxy acid dehydrogenase YdfG